MVATGCSGFRSFRSVVSIESPLSTYLCSLDIQSWWPVGDIFLIGLSYSYERKNLQSYNGITLSSASSSAFSSVDRLVSAR